LFTTNTLKQITDSKREIPNLNKMSSKPKPKLHDDILIMTVEKMFFQKPEDDEVGNKAIDFRYGNPYTFFMVRFECDIILNILYKG
jgi:hypothetical protein